jgi:precorrin-6B methylase 2
VTLQDLGSLGELIAAIATIATLAYLVVQIQQNTQALRSSTFQQISMDISLAADAIAREPELAAIIVKGSRGLSGLTAEERVRFHFYLVMTFRRLEAVYMQRMLGFIDPERTEGFERSVISVLTNGGGAEWWQATKGAFSSEFSAYVDGQLASSVHAPLHPGFGRA